MSTPNTNTNEPSPYWEFPAWLREFTFKEMQAFAKVGRLMLQGKDLLAACKELQLKNRKIVDINRRLEEEICLTILKKNGGGKLNYPQDKAIRKTIADIIAGIEQAASVLCVDVTNRTERPRVRIGAVVSVSNYLAPALQATLCRQKPNSAVHPPSIAFVSSEYVKYIDEIGRRLMDLAILPNSIELPPGMTGFELSYKTREEGLVFKLSNLKHVEPWQEAVFKATGEGLSQLKKAVFAAPIALMNWKLERSTDLISSAVDGFLSKQEDGYEIGQRIYMSTMRGARQLAHRGTSISIGHAPDILDTRGNSKGIARKVIELGGQVGFDSDVPDSQLAFLPFRELGLNIPNSPVRFQVVAFGKNGVVDKENVSPAAIDVINAIVSITKSHRERHGYLKFAQEEDGEWCLLHDSHWGGRDQYVT